MQMVSSLVSTTEINGSQKSRSTRRSMPTVPAWRRLAWQLWRDTYLENTTEFLRRAWVHHLQFDRHWLVTVRDVALGSVGLLADEPLTSGDCFQVEVWRTPDCGPCRFRVRVLSSTPRTDGRWTVQCAYARQQEIPPSLAKLNAAS